MTTPAASSQPSSSDGSTSTAAPDLASIQVAAWQASEERRRLILQGQRYGLAALALVLTAVVMLAALGQPWVAGVLAGTSLSAVVAVFITGQYVPAAPTATSVQPTERAPVTDAMSEVQPGIETA